MPEEVESILWFWAIAGLIGVVLLPGAAGIAYRVFRWAAGLARDHSPGG